MAFFFEQCVFLLIAVFGVRLLQIWVVFSFFLDAITSPTTAPMADQNLGLMLKMCVELVRFHHFLSGRNRHAYLVFYCNQENSYPLPLAQPDFSR